MTPDRIQSFYKKKLGIAQAALNALSPLGIKASEPRIEEIVVADKKASDALIDLIMYLEAEILNFEQKKYARGFQRASDMLDISEDLEINSAAKEAGRSVGIPYGPEMEKFVQAFHDHIGVPNA
jgi:hypothetical protein